MYNIFTDIIAISHCGIFPYTQDEENSNFCSTFGGLKSPRLYLSLFPIKSQTDDQMRHLEHTEWRNDFYKYRFKADWGDEFIRGGGEIEHLKCYLMLQRKASSAACADQRHMGIIDPL